MWSWSFPSPGESQYLELQIAPCWQGKGEPFLHFCHPFCFACLDLHRSSVAFKAMRQSQLAANSIAQPSPHLCRPTVIPILSLWAFTQLHNKPGWETSSRKQPELLFSRIVPWLVWLHSHTKVTKAKVTGWEQAGRQGLCWDVFAALWIYVGF